MGYIHELEDFVDVEEDLEHLDPRPIEDERNNRRAGKFDDDRETSSETIFDREEEEEHTREAPLASTTKPVPPPPTEGTQDAIPLDESDIESAVSVAKPGLSINTDREEESDLPPLISEKMDLERRGLSPGYTPTVLPSRLQVGSFSTDEIRKWDKPRTLNMSPRRFPDPFSLDPPLPTVLHGLNGLDVDHRRNLRVKASNSDVGYFGFTGFNNAWGDTILYRATSSYLAIGGNGDDTDSGRVNVKEGFPNTEKNIKFAAKFTSPPNVLVWLSGLDIEHGRNARVKVSSSSITETGFTLNIEGWHDTLLHNGTEATWFAYAEGKAGVTSGRFHTKKLPEQMSRGTVKFVPEGEEEVFTSTPTVFLAFDYLDVDKGGNTRVIAEANRVNKAGFDWSIKSWSNTKLYLVGVTYVAVE